MEATFCFDLLEKLAVGNPEAILFLQQMRSEFTGPETIKHKQALAVKLFLGLMQRCEEDSRSYGPSIYACLVGIAMSIVPRDKEFENSVLNAIYEDKD